LVPPDELVLDGLEEVDDEEVDDDEPLLADDELESDLPESDFPEADLPESDLLDSDFDSDLPSPDEPFAFSALTLPARESLR
jgi:hypothetical protein